MRELVYGCLSLRNIFILMLEYLISQYIQIQTCRSLDILDMLKFSASVCSSEYNVQDKYIYTATACNVHVIKSVCN